MGGFIGDAFVTPAFLGGQAITAMTFILIESIWLGLVAAAIVLVQAFLIPKLRKRILVLGKERQLTARQLAGRVAELVDGAVEIRALDTSNYERADISSRLARIFFIRFEIYQRKFFVKFLNNLLAQITPFVFYAGGGLLALAGHLDIGALVAVINAYKDLPSPVKELIDWDQRRLDVQIKYEQVIQQFQPPDMIDPMLQNIEADPGPPLVGDLACHSISLIDDTNTKLIDAVSFKAPVKSHMAIVGNSSSGKDHLGMLLARLVQPSSGGITIDGRDIGDLPEAVTGRRISYVGQDSYLFPGTVFDNLAYGLKHEPLAEVNYDEAERRQRSRWNAESRRAGNPTFDLKADWVDYSAAGAADSDALRAQAIALMTTLEMEEDIYRLGLKGTIDPDLRPDVAEGILKAREALVGQLDAAGANDLVVRFDPEHYNRNATLAENLLFGTPTKAEFRADALAENPIVLGALRDQGMLEDILAMGETIAKTIVELLSDLPPGHPFFEQFGFIDEDDLPDYKTLVARIDQQGRDMLTESDRELLLGLPFKYIEARHRLGLITADSEARIVAAREHIAERIEIEAAGAVEFYRPEGYNAAASLQDNILFGRLVYGQAQAEETVGRLTTEVLDSLGLRQTVLTVGLDYDVGTGGKRLSKVQRQKLAIARALLRHSDLLVVNEAASVMDAPTQVRLLQGILKTCDGRGVIWTLQRPDSAEFFEHILVMQAGRLVEQGRYDELNLPGSAFSKLMVD